MYMVNVTVRTISPPHIRSLS